ncbi:hypothetical protein NMG60_11009855 [Bertholletia excelsa]
MDRGWGLTLDSSDPAVLFESKPSSFSLTPRLQRSGSMFPLSLNRREDPPSDENRVAVDFFADKNKKPSDNDSTSGFSVKRENLSETAFRNVNSTLDDGISADAEDKQTKTEMANLQAELERMNAENQRLKGMLSHVSNNYNALQLHLVTLMQQQQNSRAETSQEHQIVEGRTEEKKPRQFLELGPVETNPSNSSSEERTISGSPPSNRNEMVRIDQDEGNDQDSKAIAREESPESEGWVSNKLQKINSSSKGADQAPETTMRKARVSVRARSEAPMISDGCQWRKYGQKMAKGNPCPRAYYRCTMAVGCPVRKQVQRCAEDKTILITTYEGTHNHPLPPAAMAMASTTSAAANMLLSGSMSSADGLMNPNFLARTILPCPPSMATISASAPFPTITLDLTHNPTNPIHFQRPPVQFPLPFPGQPQNFNPLPPPPQIFGQALYNQSLFSGLQVSQGVVESSSRVPPSAELQQPPHPSFSDTLRAATAAITADPNFTAALAAAISSIMSGGHPNNNNNAAANNPATSAAGANASSSNNKINGSFPGN